MSIDAARGSNLRTSRFARSVTCAQTLWTVSYARAIEFVCLSQSLHYILNTPNLVSGIGAFSAAESASASTRRVSLGRMMPSSHSRAVA